MRERVQMCLREHEEVRAVSPCCRGIGVHWTFGFVQRPRFSATAPQYGSEAVGQWAGAGGLSVTTKTATRRGVGEKWIGLLSLRGRCWNWAGKSLLEEKIVSKKKFLSCINECVATHLHHSLSQTLSQRQLFISVNVWNVPFYYGFEDEKALLDSS